MRLASTSNVIGILGAESEAVTVLDCPYIGSVAYFYLKLLSQTQKVIISQYGI